MYNVSMGFNELLHKRETLPPLSGCVWEFTERNTFLKPSQFPLRYSRFQDMTSAMQRFIYDISVVVEDGWSFSDTVAKHDHIAVVYTNPDRGVATTNEPEIPEFIKTVFLKERGYGLKREITENLLVGTNYVAVVPMPRYNEVDLEERKGILRRTKITRMYQTGVAYILVTVGPIEESIRISRELLPFWEWQEMPRAIMRTRINIRKLEEKTSTNPDKLF